FKPPDQTQKRKAGRESLGGESGRAAQKPKEDRQQALVEQVAQLQEQGFNITKEQVLNKEDEGDNDNKMQMEEEEGNEEEVEMEEGEVEFSEVQVGDSAGEGGDSAEQQQVDGMTDKGDEEEVSAEQVASAQEESRLRKELEKIKGIYNEMFNGGIPTAVDYHKYFAKLISFSERAVSRAESLEAKVAEVSKAAGKKTRIDKPRLKKMTDTGTRKYSDVAKAAVKELRELEGPEKVEAARKILMEKKHPRTNRSFDVNRASRTPASIKSTADIRNEKLKEKVEGVEWIYIKGIQRQRYGIIWQTLRDVGVNTGWIASISFISYNILKLAVYGTAQEISGQLAALGGKILNNFDIFKSDRSNITDTSATTTAL
ncbi:hypothetical protein HK098_006840, partial [Nowakowskiella sp. JEL0407]